MSTAILPERLLNSSSFFLNEGKKPEMTKAPKVGKVSESYYVVFMRDSSENYNNVVSAIRKVTSGAARPGVGEKGKNKKPSQDFKKINAKEEQRPMKLQQVTTVKRNEGVTKAK